MGKMNEISTKKKKKKKEKILINQMEEKAENVAKDTEKK